jgi:hypothetical protein
MIFIDLFIKIWITLKMTTPKKTLIMRVSPNTTQEEIEAATRWEWKDGVVVLKKKFPSILDANEIYWVKTFTPPEPDSEPEPLPEEGEPGMRSIMHRSTLTVPVMTFIRSHSADDFVTKRPPMTDYQVTWVVEFDHTVTQLFAPEKLQWMSSLIARL